MVAIISQKMSKTLISVTALALSISTANAQEFSDEKVKIGAMVDMSGVYSANGGPGAVLAAEMAIEDYGNEILGKPIEFVSADYQNKVSVAQATASRWFDDEDVDMIVESMDSASALSLFGLGDDRGRVTIGAGSASTRLTGDGCSKYGIHYVYDTFALATGTGNAIVKEGNTEWYFITADYAFGHSLEQHTEEVVLANGGEVLGKARHPLSTTDFASYLLQAQGSGAQVVGLANAGNDFSTAVKQANEFGITQGGQILAGMLVFLTDIQALTVDVAQGMQFTTGYYWDYDDQTREFAQRFYERHGGMPTMIHAGIYSAVTQYLKAIEATGTDDSDVVVKHMKSQPINDAFSRNGYIREDGRMVHDMYLAKIKTPAESKSEWDMAEIVRVIPGDQAYRPLELSECQYVSGNN
ncbi:MAG: ABC transporter substrate-binding protein [Marinobacter sp.]|uniref:ABC transporter substrate-binding protein n=3 Tax=Marinobacter sp. TaxID=50741 RepID=UPI003298B496